MRKRREFDVLSKDGEKGVRALAMATPVRTGLTADSWRYRVERTGETIKIVWYNENDSEGWFNVAMGIQLGHGTRNRGWVEGIDYINPAMQPIFDEIEEGVGREVQGL